MKCTSCNERNGSTRCEGCQQLYCLPCMIKHHEELAHEFELVTNTRNELKESIDSMQMASNSGKGIGLIVEIGFWEEAMTKHIREIAVEAREKVRGLMAKNMKDIQLQFEQLSMDIQTRKKEGNFLENDIDEIKRQLVHLQNDVERVTSKINVNCKVPSKNEFYEWINVREKTDSSTRVARKWASCIEQTESDVPKKEVVVKELFKRSGFRNDTNKDEPIANVNPLIRAFNPIMSNQSITCPMCHFKQKNSTLRAGTLNNCEMCDYELS